MEPSQKKAEPCNCGSGLPHWRCCGKARSRRSSPEGALELLCFLKNHPEDSYLKSELGRATSLSRWSTTAVLTWAQAQPRPLIHIKRGEDGWARFQADVPAIDAWMDSVGVNAEPPRPNGRSVLGPRRPRHKRGRTRARKGRVAA